MIFSSLLLRALAACGDTLIPAFLIEILVSRLCPPTVVAQLYGGLHQLRPGQGRVTEPLLRRPVARHLARHARGPRPQGAGVVPAGSRGHVVMTLGNTRLSN